MTSQLKTGYVDSSRLKQVNLELGHLASRHKACRVNSGIFSVLGAVVLAISLVGLIGLLPSGDGDWTQNPDSPVYSLAAQEASAFVPRAVLVGLGFLTGLGLLYSARRQCSQQRNLWKREGDLRDEMRRLRDRLYAVDQLHVPHEPHTKRETGATAPLGPAEARGEYVGVYNPAQSQQGPAPTTSD